MNSLLVPRVMSLKEWEQLSATKPHLRRVDCTALPDVGALTDAAVAEYAAFFAARAREYDELLNTSPPRDVIVHCHKGRHRSVAVAICWCVWRGVTQTPEEAEAEIKTKRGKHSGAYKPVLMKEGPHAGETRRSYAYKHAIDRAIAELRQEHIPDG